MIGRDLTPSWFDVVAVMRALDGEPVGRGLHHAEQVAVARAARGMDRWSVLMQAAGCNSKKAAALFREAQCNP